jgi:hypothetical protein
MSGLVESARAPSGGVGVRTRRAARSGRPERTIGCALERLRCFPSHHRVASDEIWPVRSEPLVQWWRSPRCEPRRHMLRIPSPQSPRRRSSRSSAWSEGFRRHLGAAALARARSVVTAVECLEGVKESPHSSSKCRRRFRAPQSGLRYRCGRRRGGRPVECPSRYAAPPRASRCLAHRRRAEFTLRGQR